MALAVSACGGSSGKTTTTTTTSTTTPSGSSTAKTTPSSSVPPSTKSTATEHLSVAANPKGEFHYEPSTLSAKEGVASITFANSSPVAHNMTIEDSAGKIVGGTTTFTGGSHTIRIALKAGTYKFFCTVPGHRQAGMEGTLTVQ